VVEVEDVGRKDYSKQLMVFLLTVNFPDDDLMAQ
jgi:hypothetical protein